MSRSYATDPYAVLGVAPNATPDELKRAYRTLARDHHPDRNPGDPDAEARFKAIAEAYATVTDPTWQRSRADRSAVPEDYLGDFTDALERAEALVFFALLPRYRTAFGGRGERVLQFAHDVATGGLRSRAEGPAPAWWARLQARWELRRITVHIDYGRNRRAPAEVWPLSAGGWAIVLYPSAFWGAGVRDAAALDDAVLKALALKVAAIQGAPLHIPFGAYDWDLLLARVHEDDKREARWIWTRRAAWAAVALLSAFLLWLGASGR